ncbi:uncharacterized protein LOC113160957 [Anabas testudineus]|uniref:uncharacterized protein LOC113160957 n=1 Tax=Anabas testudineus TaxID=64144 RepID=UPI000E459EFE|nr:uncharacterized protein LOC113160957 [Anabas testudineus]
MIVLWVTLLTLQEAYALAPVVSVQLGEPVTFTCVLPQSVITRREVYWYRQSAGDTLKLMVTLRSSKKSEYSKEFSESRFKVDDNKDFISLTILSTTYEDEGMYLCEISDWATTPEWTGTYLLLKGNNERTSNYTVVQTVSDPVRPGHSVTLQCSVLSDSDKKMCPRDPSVYWFRAGSDQSHPNIIYTGGNNKCKRRTDSLKNCAYRFSKTVGSSDAGTYYCAVATCGQILFGDGVKVDGTEVHTKETNMWSQTTKTIILLLCVVLVDLIVTGFVFYLINSGRNADVNPHKKCGGQKSQQRLQDMWAYTAVIFTMMKSDNGGNKDVAKVEDRARIYTAVRAFGLHQ